MYAKILLLRRAQECTRERRFFFFPSSSSVVLLYVFHSLSLSLCLYISLSFSLSLRPSLELYSSYRDTVNGSVRTLWTNRYKFHKCTAFRSLQSLAEKIYDSRRTAVGSRVPPPGPGRRSVTILFSFRRLLIANHPVPGETSIFIFRPLPRALLIFHWIY